jgi:hypothetical protein
MMLYVKIHILIEDLFDRQLLTAKKVVLIGPHFKYPSP